MKLRSIKSIPFKVFMIVLLAGIIGVAGMIIMKYDIDRLSENYREIIDEHSVNRSYMEEISSLVYEHQAVISNYVIAVSDEQRAGYKKSDDALRSKISTCLYEFNQRMEGDKREQLYHKLYSNYFSYLRNADIVLDLIDDGSTATALHYTNNVLNDYVEKINRNLNELDDLTVSEMDKAKERMEYYINFAKRSEAVCILFIVVSMTACLIYCVKLTIGLDRYKDELEKDVQEKTEILNKHNKKIISIQNNTIIGMANLIESRDGDTGEHIKRTSIYVEMLARAAAEKRYCSNILDDEYIEHLVKAAPMHDIGKISIPDSILQKPGKLTDDEFEIIKRHATEGGRIIRDVLGSIEEKEYVDIAVEVASGHHEKWDGTGYPVGLKGSDIPISARIMAIADVFDALVSKRCYKEAMKPDKAFKIIEESAGTHFDPVLAKLFIKMKKEIMEIIS